MYQRQFLAESRKHCTHAPQENRLDQPSLQLDFRSIYSKLTTFTLLHSPSNVVGRIVSLVASTNDSVHGYNLPFL